MELEEAVEIAEGSGELNPGPLETWQVLAWVQSNAPSLDKFASRSGASGPYVPGPGVAVVALLWVSGVIGSLIHPTSSSFPLPDPDTQTAGRRATFQDSEMKDQTPRKPLQGEGLPPFLATPHLPGSPQLCLLPGPFFLLPC